MKDILVEAKVDTTHIDIIIDYIESEYVPIVYKEAVVKGLLDSPSCIADMRCIDGYFYGIFHNHADGRTMVCFSEKGVIYNAVLVYADIDVSTNTLRTRVKDFRVLPYVEVSDLTSIMR